MTRSPVKPNRFAASLLASLCSAAVLAEVPPSTRTAPVAPAPAPAPAPASAEQLARTIDASLELIEREFVTPMTREELVSRALRLLLQDLDPYSRYLDPQERAIFEADLTASFAGMGVRIDIDEAARVPRIERVNRGSPAHEAGVEVGDLLVRIDGFDVAGWPIERAISVMRGAEGSVATLGILRGDPAAPMTLRVTRRIIELPSVHGASRLADGRSSHLLGSDDDGVGDVGYIRISRLATDTAALVAKALAEIGRLQATGLVLDLRGCIGGSLDTAVATADLFLDDGVIVSVQTRNARRTESANAGTLTDLPMVVLIDDETASSGEILAGALRDHERATFVGQRTFGKGRVQEHMALGDDLGSVILTTGAFQRPSGRTIDRHDVPDSPDDAGIAPHPGYEVVIESADRAAWREMMAELESLPSTSNEARLLPVDDPGLRVALGVLSQAIRTKP